MPFEHTLRQKRKRCASPSSPSPSLFIRINVFIALATAHHNRHPHLNRHPITNTQSQSQNTDATGMLAACSYFLMGRCRLSAEKCPFAHSLTAPRRLCKYGTKCSFGAKCVFRHPARPSPTQVSNLPQEGSKDAQCAGPANASPSLSQPLSRSKPPHSRGSEVSLQCLEDPGPMFSPTPFLKAK